MGVKDMDVRKLTGTLFRVSTVTESRPRILRTRIRARRDRGSALVEFALVLPVFLLFCTGAMSFGVVFNQYLELTNAVTIGAQILADSRGDTSAPCTQAISAVYNAAPFLKQSNLVFTISFINGTPSQVSGGTPITYTNGKTTAQAQCDSEAEAANSTILQQDQNVELLATYSCNLLFYATKLPCNLEAETIEVIQ
jgi:Flp pilus assembly protein TadG